MRIRAVLLMAGVAAALVFGVSVAAADTVGTVTIVGPSDVSDSALMTSMIVPQFEAAFPQFAASYTGSAQNTAENNAKSGAASVLLLHEPKLEADFVAGGYSLENHFGSALFYGEYVLAGTAADSARVAAGAPHDIARAFAAVAAAGVAGNADFLSRGGSFNAPANTLEEHAVWKLVHDSGLTPSGVQLCEVSSNDGGGWTPIVPGATEPNAPDCPDSGTVSGADLPFWYRVESSLNQPKLVTAANACVAATDCYALTDRGTFDFVAKAGQAPNLSILSSGQSATAPGGSAALLTRFHGYVVNPAKVSGINPQGAEDFISFLTSPAEQAKIGAYLSNVPQAPGSPFVPDASPSITAAASPSSVAPGGAVTVSGSVTDPEPGSLGLAGQPVAVRPAGGAEIVAGVVDIGGHYSFSFVPPASGSYEVFTGPISRLLEPTGTPPFGDVLSPAASAPFTVTVTPPNASTSQGSSSAGGGNPTNGGAPRETVRIGKVSVKGGKVTVTGTLGSAAVRGAKVSLLVDRLTFTGGHGHRADAAKVNRSAFKKVAIEPVAAGEKTLSISAKLRPGHYKVELHYAAPPAPAVTSSPRRVVVG